MKLAIISTVALVLGVVAAGPAQKPQKAVIVTYPTDTPSSVVDQAMDAIRQAGGMITHEYKIIKGFAAKAPATVLDTVSAWGAPYHAMIEEDQMVSANA